MRLRFTFFQSDKFLNYYAPSEVDLVPQFYLAAYDHNMKQKG